MRPGAGDLPGPPAVLRVRTVRQIPAPRWAGTPRTAAGLVAPLQRPDVGEARLPAAPAGAKGGGWTVLTVGQVPGAHWLR
ncbi:hypothetical protein [Actinacidiphila glaucinigra]|uniref:hypothetical protein n=1 Tax=Actinacidiphila glaucinigra TaxID=235986 RepID=UPI00371A181E